MTEGNEPVCKQLLSVTMTPEAALRFQAALHHAAARIEDEGQVEWLLWGASRVAYSEPVEQPTP